MDEGKALVQSYKSIADAQKIFNDLCHDALRSTHSSIDSSRLLSYITSVRIGDGHWNGTSHSFILHWQEQVWLYESLVDRTTHFSPEQKMHMLQNADHPMDELRQVKNQANQLQAFHGRVMSYDTYCNLLLSAASNSDTQHAPKGRVNHTAVKTPRRNIYAHDLADYGDDESNDIYNLDSNVVDLQANVHKQHSKAPTFAGNGTSLRPCLMSQQCHSLQPDAQATWDLLSDEAKAIILGLCKDPGK